MLPLTTLQTLIVASWVPDSSQTSWSVLSSGNREELGPSMIVMYFTKCLIRIRMRFRCGIDSIYTFMPAFVPRSAETSARVIVPGSCRLTDIAPQSSTQIRVQSRSPAQYFVGRRVHHLGHGGMGTTHAPFQRLLNLNKSSKKQKAMYAGNAR